MGSGGSPKVMVLPWARGTLLARQALGHVPADCKCAAVHLYVTHLKPCMFPKHKYMAPCPAEVTIDFNHVLQNNIPNGGNSSGRFLKSKLLCISL